METFKSGMKCAESTIKAYHVKLSHTFYQLLTMSQNLLKISFLTCIQVYIGVCHSLIERVLRLSSGQWSHTQSPRHWFLEQETSQFISPDQTVSTSVWWHTLPVASLIACLPISCSKCQRTKEVSAGHLKKAWNYYRQCSNNISQGSVATHLRCGKIIIFILDSLPAAGRQRCLPARQRYTSTTEPS